MRKRTLVLTRGLPGSAKSTLARTLAPNANFAADDFFEDAEGNYNFDLSKLGEAHADCMARTRAAMEASEPVVAVHNTFSKAWEAAAYYEMAVEHGYGVFVVECQNDFGNIHNVPQSTVDQMRDSWEPLGRDRTPLHRVARARFCNSIKAALRRS